MKELYSPMKKTLAGYQYRHRPIKAGYQEQKRKLETEGCENTDFSNNTRLWHISETTSDLVW